MNELDFARAQRALYGSGEARLRTAWRRAAAAAMLVAGSAAAGADEPADAPRPTGVAFAARHAQAVQALQSRRYAAAYVAFAELADRGHAASAALALAMLNNGPAVFGAEWSATAAQLRRWTELVDRDVIENGLLLADHDRGE